MLKLTLPREERWLELPLGVRVRVRPLNTALYEGARARAWRLARELARQQEEANAVGARLEGLPDLSDPDALQGLSQFLFAQALAQTAISEWKGVELSDGRAAPVTDETVGELMQVHTLAEAFVVAYTAPLLEVLAEGKSSAPAANGTSAAGATIATDVPGTAETAPGDGAA